MCFDFNAPFELNAKLQTKEAQLAVMKSEVVRLSESISEERRSLYSRVKALEDKNVALQSLVCTLKSSEDSKRMEGAEAEWEKALNDERASAWKEKNELLTQIESFRRIVSVASFSSQNGNTQLINMKENCKI